MSDQRPAFPIRCTIDFYVRPGPRHPEVEQAIAGIHEAVGRAMAGTPFPPAVMIYVERLSAGFGEVALADAPHITRPEPLSK